MHSKINILLLSIFLCGPAVAEVNPHKQLSELMSDRDQEVNASGQKGIIDILVSQGYSCASIKASRSFPSEGKKGFAVICDNDVGYAIYWRSGKSVIYKY